MAVGTEVPPAGFEPALPSPEGRISAEIDRPLTRANGLQSQPVSREMGTSWENRPLAGPSLRACSRRSVSLVNPLDRDTAAGPGGSSARSGRELRLKRWVEARILDGSYLRRCVFDFGQIADLLSLRAPGEIRTHTGRILRAFVNVAVTSNNAAYVVASAADRPELACCEVASTSTGRTRRTRTVLDTDRG